MGKVPPLKSRTMTLNQLQLETLNMIRLVKFQLNRQGWEGGMSDAEFIDKVLAPLEFTIYADRNMLKMLRERKPPRTFLTE